MNCVNKIKYNLLIIGLSPGCGTGNDQLKTYQIKRIIRKPETGDRRRVLQIGTFLGENVYTHLDKQNLFPLKKGR